MVDLKQLELLEQLAHARHDDATLELGKARQALSAAEQQRTLLTNYNGDYQNRFGSEAAGGMSSDLMRNYRGFIDNVAKAIAQQDVEVVRRQANVKKVEANWRETHRNLESFRALRQRELQRLHCVADQRRQKNEDEFAQRAASYGMRTAF